MNEKGVAMLVGTCLVLVWLFGGTPAKKVEPIPVDGLIESVASVKESLTVESDYITDAAKEAAVSISLAKSLAENHIPDAKQKVDPQPSPSDKHEKAKREIVLFTIDGCRDCENWKRCEQPKFEADGWVVVKSDDPMKGPWPHFIIEKNNRQTEHRGYLPFAKVDEVAK